MIISKYTQADIITAGIVLCPQQELMGSAEDVTWGGGGRSIHRESRSMLKEEKTYLHGSRCSHWGWILYMSSDFPLTEAGEKNQNNVSGSSPLKGLTNRKHQQLYNKKKTLHDLTLNTKNE